MRVEPRYESVDPATGERLASFPLASPAEVEAYAGSGEPFGKAGGYAIQERGDRFVTRVEGSWTNVVGLPMELVGRMLEEAGIL